MNDLNAIAAWFGILAGVVTGAAFGLFFHRDGWLGGYASWPRRMLRLGHISFFGIGLLNLAYALTVRQLGWPNPPIASIALAATVLLMPTACYLSAWKKPLRHLFPVPVACVVVATASLLTARLHS